MSSCGDYTVIWFNFKLETDLSRVTPPQPCLEGVGPSIQSDPSTLGPLSYKSGLRVTLEKSRLPFSEYFGAAEYSEVRLCHG